MASPLISALLPVHNRAQWVGRAVESVLAQRHARVELIVIDDGSTDETAAALERFGEQLVLVQQPRRGAYAARNLGLRHARGELIAFIDSDDRWYPDRLARQLPLLDASDVGLVFGNAVLIDHRVPTRARRRLTAFQITPPRRGWVTRHFAYGNFVPTSSVLVRRGCLQELGGFPETPPLSADYLTWFRISVRHRFDYVPEPVFEYAVHAGGISSDLVKSLHARIQLFTSLLTDTIESRTANELRRVLFHLHLSLAVAWLRRDPLGARRVLTGSSCGLRGSSWREGLRWSLEFIGNQIRVRLGRRSERAGDAGRDPLRGA